MNEDEANETNPYHSPPLPANESGAESPSVVEAARERGNVKECIAEPFKIKWLGECLVLGVLIGLSPFFSYLPLLLEGPIRRWIPVIPAMLDGVILGLALALLVNSFVGSQFTRLQPGHWRLVASSVWALNTVVAEALESTGWFGGQETVWDQLFPSPTITWPLYFTSLGLIGLFYALVVRTTHERGWWKGYAWLALVGCVANFLQTFLLVDPFHLELIPYFALPMELSLAIGWLTATAPYLIVVPLIGGLIMDYRRNVARDVYHYVGVFGIAILPGIDWWLGNLFRMMGI